MKAGKIGGKAVTAPKLAPDSIKSTKIQDESLKTDDYGPGTVTGAKLATGAVDTDKIAGNAVTKEKVSSDIPYRRTLESTFTAGAGYLPLVSFGDAELQGRCRTAGANGFMELRVISPNNGAQADMTGTDREAK